MKKFKVFRRRWIGKVDPQDLFTPVYVEMVPVMTISAKTPEAALRIAKQKGEVAPIIGEVDHA